MFIDIFNTDKKYDLIYADPPWRYGFSKSSNREIENKYETMTLDDIKKLPIPSSENCVLYLWATAPKLIEALEVMLAWGFEYKTHCVWNKELLGMGYWFRGQHELLLVGVKGKFSPPSPKHRLPSIYNEKRTVHSKKPLFYVDYFELAFPKATKIELFARNRHPNWDCWGNDENIM